VLSYLFLMERLSDKKYARIPESVGWGVYAAGFVPASTSAGDAGGSTGGSV
jgi:hypothetical protein